jgi:hypothetical protein
VGIWYILGIFSVDILSICAVGGCFAYRFALRTQKERVQNKHTPNQYINTKGKKQNPLIFAQNIIERPKTKRVHAFCANSVMY